MRYRLGDIALETIGYDTSLEVGGAQMSFHPAGHVPGSAQIRVEVRGEIWVASGDYKTTPDGLFEPFEPIKCYAFITESTFGLPVFRWSPQSDIATHLNTWWRTCQTDGKTAMLGAYTLGKAQRLLSMLDPEIGPILTHGAVGATTEVLKQQGYHLPETTQVAPDTQAKAYPGAPHLVPLSALESTWARRFNPVPTGFASGWMQLRGVRRRRMADRGFVVSDHADWAGLLWAIQETGAEKIFVTHGYTDIFTRWLNDQGWDAAIVSTEFEGEALDAEAA